MYLQMLLVHHTPLLMPFFSIFAFSRALIFLCFLLFQGIMSFELIGLPCFMRILDSFASYPSETLIHARAFAAGLFDFVILFVSVKATRN